MPVHTLAHQHARPRRCLKHIINPISSQGTTLFIRPRTDLTRNFLRLSGLDEL